MYLPLEFPVITVMSLSPFVKAAVIGVEACPALIPAFIVVVIAPLGEVAPFSPAMTGSALQMFPAPAQAEGCDRNGL